MKLIIPVALLLLLSGCGDCEREAAWVPAKLISQQVVISHRSPDEYVSLWDCGEYGVLESRRKRVFQNARLAKRVKIEKMLYGLMVTDIDDANK